MGCCCLLAISTARMGSACVLPASHGPPPSEEVGAEEEGEEEKEKEEEGEEEEAEVRRKRCNVGRVLVD